MKRKKHITKLVQTTLSWQQTCNMAKKQQPAFCITEILGVKKQVQVVDQTIHRNAKASLDWLDKSAPVCIHIYIYIYNICTSARKLTDCRNVSTKRPLGIAHLHTHPGPFTGLMRMTQHPCSFLRLFSSPRPRTSHEDLPICQHVDLSHELLDFFGQHVERRIFFPGDRRRVCGGRSDGSDGRVSQGLMGVPCHSWCRVFAWYF